MNRIDDLSIGQCLAVDQIFFALSGQIMTPRLCSANPITEVMELYRQKMFRSEAISLNQLLISF